MKAVLCEFLMNSQVASHMESVMVQSRAQRAEVELEGGKFLAWAMIQQATVGLAEPEPLDQEGLANWIQTVIHSCQMEPEKKEGSGGWMELGSQLC